MRAADAGEWLEKVTCPDPPPRPADNSCQQCHKPKEPDREKCAFCAACAKAIWDTRPSPTPKEPEMLPRWTPEEDTVLKKNASKGLAHCAKLLPGRSPDAIKTRARDLSVSLKKQPRICPHCNQEKSPQGFDKHLVACARLHAPPKEAPAADPITAPAPAQGAAISEEKHPVPSAVPDDHEIILPIMGHGERGTRLMDEAFARVTGTTDPAGGFLIPGKMPQWPTMPILRFDDVYCVYCRRYTCGECKFPDRDYVTGERISDIMTPQLRKEEQLCDPRLTFLGHVRKALGLEVG